MEAFISLCVFTIERHENVVYVCGQVDLGDLENEVRSAEEAAKKAMSDAQRLTEDLRRQQDAASSAEKQRKSFESQARVVFSIMSSRCSFDLDALSSFSIQLSVRSSLLPGLCRVLTCLLSVCPFSEAVTIAGCLGC